MSNEQSITQAFNLAREQFGELGVDVDAALEQLAKVPISMHCWQGDDVGGFENSGEELSGGIAVTGNFLGRARTPDELRQDASRAYSLIPGTHRFNLHASYAETSGKQVERNQLEPNHFQNWIDWASNLGIGIDFNPTYFSHPLSADGFTLAHQDEKVRQFWIEHGIVSRNIGAAIGKALNTPCINNFWIPDGYKDTPVDRKGPRERLTASLDAIFAEPIDPSLNLDAVEAKLFGIGSESYVVGSHEYYLGYAVKNNKLLCLDAGHFHPTEVISDKISSVMEWVPELLLHVSRGVRWDSDHVVTLTDELRAIMQEIVRGDFLSRVHIGLDFFDASINRVAAWVIGTRCAIKALLFAMLEPTKLLQQMENDGDFSSRLAMQEEVKTMPSGAIWDYYCLQADVPVGSAWLTEVKRYEQEVLSKR